MKKTVVPDSRGASIQLDLGVPGARNARIFALVGLAITAIVGLLLWDLLGLILGIPIATVGLVQGARSVGRSRAYPRDRRAAITAIAAGLAAFVLAILIVARAEQSGNQPVGCGDNQACLEEQGSGD